MNDTPIMTDAPTPARPEILAPAGDTPSFLAALAAGHAGAALMHRYVFHDGVLQSMLPWRSKG